MDDQACSDLLRNENQDAGDKEGESYSKSSESCTSSVDGVHACCDLLANERGGESIWETTFSWTFDTEDITNTGNSQQLKCKSTSNENLIVSECGQATSETLKDDDKNQVTTPRVGFCDLPSGAGAEEDEETRQYRDSNNKRDSSDAHKTKVFGSTSRECRQCNQAMFKEGDNKHQHGNENLRKQVDLEITHPKTLASFTDPHITHPKTLVPAMVTDPEITQPKTLVPPMITDPEITQPKTLVPPVITDPEITQLKTVEPPMVTDPEITQPKTLVPPVITDPEITQLKTVEPPMVTDPEITQPKTLVPATVTDPDITQPKTLVPPIVTDQETTFPKTLAQPSDTDPDRTHRKTPASETDSGTEDHPPKTETDTNGASLANYNNISEAIKHLVWFISLNILMEYDRNIGRREDGQSSPLQHCNSDKYDTSLGSEDSGIGDSSDEESVNNVPQHPDETFPKEAFASDHEHLYTSVENVSEPNSYSILHYPGNTFRQLVFQPDLKDNAAKSQYMPSRKDTAGKDCQGEQDASAQREQTDNQDETHPKEVTAVHDSESMTELEPEHRINQLWIDDKTTGSVPVKHIFNDPIDPPVPSGLEANNFIDNNTSKMGYLKKDREISNQTHSFKQDLDIRIFKAVTAANKVVSPCSSPDPVEAIPKTAVQQLSSKQESDSEDTAFSKANLSPESSQEDQSIIMSDHSSPNCDTTTLPGTVIDMFRTPLDIVTSYSPTHESSKKTCNDKHRRDIHLQSLQRMLLSFSLKDTEHLSTVLKNLILTDSSVIRQHMLADLMSSMCGRNPVQEPSERGTDETEARLYAPMIEESKPGLGTSLPSSSHIDENNVNHNLKQGNKESNPKTHRSYFNQRENDWQDPLSFRRSDGKTKVDYKNYITGMNDVSGKVIKDLGQSRIDPISEQIKDDQFRVNPGVGPDCPFDIHGFFSKETISEPEQEQEAIYNSHLNTLGLPHTHGRPDLSLGVQQQHSDGSDAGLGKDETPEMTGSSQVGRQDVQTGQLYSLPAKLRDYLGRATTAEMSECQQTANDSPPPDSEQDFPQPQDRYEIPSKLQEYGSSEGSVCDSDTDETTNISQITSISKLLPHNLDGLTNLTHEDSQQPEVSHSTQPDPVQQQTKSERTVSDSGPDDVLLPFLVSKLSHHQDGLTNLTHEDSQQPEVSPSTQPDPAIYDAHASEQAVKEIVMPMSDQSLHAAGVPVHGYTAEVRTSNITFQNPAGDASGRTDASGSGTDDDSSCRTRKVELNTVKIIFNEYMEVPQTKEKQCLIIKTPDRLERQSDSVQLLTDQERQNIFDNCLPGASGTNRVTIRNNQREGYLRVPDEMNLIQDSEFVLVKEGFDRDVGAGGQEDEDDKNVEEEEKVQHNQENWN